MENPGENPELTRNRVGLIFGPKSDRLFLIDRCTPSRLRGGSKERLVSLPSATPRPHEMRGKLNLKRTVIAGAAAFTLGVIPILQTGVVPAIAAPEMEVAQQTTPANSSSDNVTSARQAADWIVDLWQQQPESFIVGPLTESIIALSSLDLPDTKYINTINAMLAQLKQLAPDFIGPADKVADDEVKIEALGKIIIALDAADQNPASFLTDRDLVAELSAVANSGNRSVTREWAPYFTTIALGRLGQPIPQDMVDALWDIQDTGGSFLLRRVNGSYVASADRTAMGIEAMQIIANSPKTTEAQKIIAEPSVKNAVAWANGNHLADEAGNKYWGKNSPAYTTGLLASAMADAGVDVSSAQAFLRALQTKTEGGRGWDFQPGEYEADQQATTAAILALTGRGYATAKLTKRSAPLPGNPGVDDAEKPGADDAEEDNPSSSLDKPDDVQTPEVSTNPGAVMPGVDVPDGGIPGVGEQRPGEPKVNKSRIDKSGASRPRALPKTGQASVDLSPLVVLFGIGAVAGLVAIGRRKR